MAGSRVKIGFGAQFFMASALDVLTKLAEVTNLDIPDETTEEEEVTHYESPNATKEFIAGLNDAGEIKVDMNYIGGSATDLLILEAKSARDVRDMKIVIPSDEGDQAFTFPGIIKRYGRSAPLAAKQTASLTIRVAGAVVQADAA